MDGDAPKASAVPEGWHGDNLGLSYSRAADDGGQSQQRREAAMLFSVAEGHLDDQASEEARRAAEDALARFREVSDTVGVADSLRLIAHATYELSQTLFAKGKSEEWHTLLQDAEAAMQKELQSFRDMNDTRGQACLLLSLGELILGWPGGRRLEEVLDYLLDAQDLARQIEDDSLEAKATLVRGKLLHRWHRFKGAAKAFAEAAALFRRVGDARSEAQALCGHALSSDWMGSTEDGNRSRNKALKIVREAGRMRRSEVIILLSIGEDALSWTAEYQVAIAAARKAKGICLSDGFTRWMVTVQSMIVLGHLRNHDGKAAAQEAAEAVAFAKEKGSQQDVLTALGVLTKVYVQIEDHQEALDVAAEAVWFSSDDGSNPLFHAQALVCLAEVYDCCESYEKAEQKAMEAIALVQDLIGYEETTFSYLQFVARTRVKRDDYEGAEDAMSIARRLAERVEDTYHEGQALLGLSGTQALQGDFDKAFKALELARDRFREEGYVKGEGMVLKSMADYRCSMGDSQSAADLIEEASRLMEEGGYLAYDVSLKNLRAEFLLGLGKHSEGAAVAMEALRQARRMGSRTLLASTLMVVITINSCILEAFSEESQSLKSYRQSLDKLMRYAKEALGIAVKVKLVDLEAWATYYVGRIQWRMGRLKESLQSVHSTIRLAREAAEHSVEVSALLIHGMILLEQGEPARAVDVWQSGIRLSRDVLDGWGVGAFQDAIDAIEGPQRAPEMALVPQLRREAPQAGPEASAGKVEEFHAPDQALVTRFIMILVRTIAGSDDIPADSPLMESGIDSLSSVELRTRLQSEFRVSLPATVMFNYPTVNGMSRLLVEECTHKKISWGAG